MQDAFLDASGGRALLLPRIRPIGSADDDERLIGGFSEEFASADALEVPPAIDAIERHLTLTSLVMAWHAARHANMAAATDTGLLRTEMALAQTPAEASGLARGLARLMDQVETEGADLARLAELAPSEFA